MRQSLLALFFLCNALPSFAQHTAPSIKWEHSFGGSRDENISRCIPIADKGYIACGLSYSSDHDVSGNRGSYDYWVIKTDAEGSLLWQKCLGGSQYDHGQAIIEITKGNRSSYVIAGFTASPDGDISKPSLNEQGWVVKIDDKGSIVWEGSYGGAENDRIHDIAATTDGGFILTGYTYSAEGDYAGNHGANDLWLLKVDSLGKTEWQKVFGGGGSDIGNTVTQCNDGTYLAGGFSSSVDGDIHAPKGGVDFWVVKADASGNLLWEHSYGGNGQEELQELQQTADNGFILAGYADRNDGDVSGVHGGNDFWLVKTDASGALIWQKTFGGSDAEYAYSVRQTGDKGYVLCGETASFEGNVKGNHGNTDCWVVKTDAAGALEWQKALGGTSFDYGRSIRETTDGGYIVGASSWSADGDLHTCYGVKDYWMVKLHKPASGINEQLEEKGFYLAPNPATSKVTLHHRLGSSGRYLLFDATGKCLLHRATQEDTEVLDVSCYPAGVYVLKVEDAEGACLIVRQIVRQ